MSSQDPTGVGDPASRLTQGAVGRRPHFLSVGLSIGCRSVLMVRKMVMTMKIGRGQGEGKEGRGRVQVRSHRPFVSQTQK